MQLKLNNKFKSFKMYFKVDFALMSNVYELTAYMDWSSLCLLLAVLYDHCAPDCPWPLWMSGHIWTDHGFSLPACLLSALMLTQITWEGGGWVGGGDRDRDRPRLCGVPSLQLLLYRLGTDLRGQ